MPPQPDSAAARPSIARNRADAMTRNTMTAQRGDRALRVLVVDDHQLFRTGLRELLELEGFTVRDVGDGDAALRLVPSFAPDVVLMDATMPGLGGTRASG